MQGSFMTPKHIQEWKIICLQFVAQTAALIVARYDFLVLGALTGTRVVTVTYRDIYLLSPRVNHCDVSV